MAWANTRLPSLLGVRYPLIQAPMARVSTVELVAAVCNAGAVGSLAGGALALDDLRRQIEELRALTDAPFAVNVFAPLPEPQVSPEVIERVRELIEPARARFGLDPAPPPASGALPSFDDQLEVVLESRPAAFSFTFGIPHAALAALRDAGITTIGTATTVGEAVELERAGCDVVCAQGSEAGGHRGTFAEPFDDGLIGTVALVPQVVDRVDVPVVAAGGIMDGRGVAAALALGADGAQLGTAFIAVAESGAAEAYRRSLADGPTKVSHAFTGRPARGLRSEFFDELEREAETSPYPVHQALTRDLTVAALEQGEPEFAIRLAGQGAPMVRSLPAGELVAAIVRETDDAVAALRSS